MTEVSPPGMTSDQTPLLAAQNITLSYKPRRVRVPWSTHTKHDVLALDDVSIDVYQGEILGIVGESGSGKSSLARVLVGLQKPTSGTVTIGENSSASGKSAERRHLHRGVQMVFQDSLNSLDPGMSVLDSVAEAHLVNHPGSSGSASRRAASEFLTDLGLATAMLSRRPLELSGGQRQRVNLARALVCEPKIVVADEPTSALDVTTRVRILELILSVRDTYDVSFVFISHDLNIVRFLCDRAVVMERGRVVETGVTNELFDHPGEPYTEQLVRATPSLTSVIGRLKA
ncbi:MAG: glutathione transporter ATP-binding protein [Subtercola sp.]|nr:glutathione transporter ATP-binding protein [Subtercola sp.]